MSGNNVRMSIFIWKRMRDTEIVAAVYDRRNPKDRRIEHRYKRAKIYSTISRIARWPWRAAELASKARMA